MDLSHLTPEMRKRVHECKTTEEVLALAGEVGHALTDEELEAISGGQGGWYERQCPKCKSFDTEIRKLSAGIDYVECNCCGYRYELNNPV